MKAINKIPEFEVSHLTELGCQQFSTKQVKKAVNILMALINQTNIRFESQVILEAKRCLQYKKRENYAQTDFIYLLWATSKCHVLKKHKSPNKTTENMTI